MASPSRSVAFIGLGVMGYGMAVNLRSKLDHDQTFYICDVNDQAIEHFMLDMKACGPIHTVKNGYEAIKAADTVFTMLPTGEAVKKVNLHNETGIIAGFKKAAAADPSTHKLIVECGTIESGTILEVGKAAEAAQSSLSSGSVLNFVDASVSGGPNG